MKKKYCIFAAHYLPHLGGIERYVYNLAEKLKECGDEVVIVTSKIDEQVSYEVLDGIPVYRVSCYELLGGRYPVLKYDKNTRKVFRILSEKHFDVVLINARFYIHSIAGALFAKKNKISCAVLEHGSGHLKVHNKVLDRIGEIYEHFHTFILKCICNQFYGTCEACNMWLRHFHIESKGIIYNAINMQEVEKSLCKKNEYRKKYGIKEEDKVIVFTGRLIKEKGLLNLLDAFEKLNQKRKDVYLLIAGVGELEETIKKRENKHIIYLGYIEHEDVFRLLDEGDIYCLPSVSEAFCGGVLEAVACKCYVITTAQGGSKELISSKDLGTIMETNDAEIVYQALDDCIQNWEKSLECVENVYKKLVTNYTWDIIVQNIKQMEFER